MGRSVIIKTASAYFFDDVRHGVRITENASVFTAELYAIKLALLRLQQVREQNTFVICSDSLSALKSLQNGLLHNPLLAEVIYVYNAIRGRQLNISLDSLSCGYTRERAG